VSIVKKKHILYSDTKIKMNLLGTCSTAAPWLRWLATGLSPRRAGFAPGSIHVVFVVDDVALGHVFFPPSSSVFSCQYHSTVVFRTCMFPG
jgi:hypothetical protein